VELAALLEARDEVPEARQLLLRAADVDHAYMPRWALANFYFRQNQEAEFWRWTHNAFDIPSGNLDPLFALCWRVQPDASVISRVIPDNPDVLSAFISFLARQRHFQGIPSIGSRLIAHGSARGETTDLLAVVDRLIAEDAGNQALDLWRQLMNAGWIYRQDGLPYNSAFNYPIQQEAFDWRIPDPGASGVYTSHGAGYLQIRLSGNQPERCLLLSQVIPIQYGAYVAEANVEVEGDSNDASGVHWLLIHDKSGAQLALSPDLHSGKCAWSFALPVSEVASPPNPEMFWLKLVYERAPGTTRTQRTIALHSVSIRRVGDSAASLPKSL
jgi:hypothetical protein